MRQIKSITICRDCWTCVEDWHPGEHCPNCNSIMDWSHVLSDLVRDYDDDLQWAAINDDE